MLRYTALKCCDRLAQRCLVFGDQYFAVVKNFGILRIVHLEYVTKNQMVAKAWEKAVQELIAQSITTRIAVLHTNRTCSIPNYAIIDVSFTTVIVPTSFQGSSLYLKKVPWLPYHLYGG